MEILFTALYSFVGWVLWNLFELKEAKEAFDAKDIPFGFGAYASKKWDNWLYSLVFAFALVLVGHAGLGFQLVKVLGDDWRWSDLYYFGSGFISEAISYVYRRWFRHQTLADKNNGSSS